MSHEEALEKLRRLGAIKCLLFFELPLNRQTDFESLSSAASELGWITEFHAETSIARLRRTRRGEVEAKAPATSRA